MYKKRIIAALLSLALTASVAPAFAEENDEQITGAIKATLRFDYPQLLTRVEENNINVTLYDKSGEELGTIPVNGEISGKLSENITAVKKNVDGGVLTNEREIGYFDIDVNSLPLGEYSLGFKGDGYLDYKTPLIKLDDYSRQVIIGTGDKTFSIGDVNNDGKVDSKDRDIIEKMLGSTDSQILDQYDLNGDRKIDIIDLAYVNHQIKASGDALIYDTALIAQKAVKTDSITEAVNVVGGSVGNIFIENNVSPVTLNAKNDASELAIPIELNRATELEQIEVVSPEGTGALTAGVAEVTYEENGSEKTERIPFDYSVPETVKFLNEREGTSSVVISLGKRVAVKKVVINVTRVEGVDGTPTYAVVQEVKFLKDIVPENPAPQALSVKNVKVEAGSKCVTLRWAEFPNISGYKVYYGESGGVLDKVLTVNTNSALVEGLKNLKTYYFTVSPISEDWEGGRSEVVSAIPQPDSAPLKPDMIRVTPMDKALSLSWKTTEDATYYRVFYKKSDEESFTEIPDGKITVPSAVIGGLENDTPYLLYIIAGNNIGEGPKSDLTEGIPKSMEVKPPEIPTLHQIDKSNIESIEMTNPNNVNKAEYPNGYSVQNVADGDYNTHWTARAFWESNNFTFTFKEAKEMNYMVYVPRLDGNYRRSLERYSIVVWDEEGNQKQVVQSKVIPINSSVTGYMILPFEKSMVKKLAVSVSQWAGSPTGVSLSEAVFYESDNLAADVRALFANDIYTELTAAAMADKAGTAKKIEELCAQANDANGYYVDKDILLDELELAKALLNGSTDALGIIKTGVKSRSAGADGAKYKQSGSELQPLGAVAYATSYAERAKLKDTRLTVYADIPEGETVTLVATQHFAEANAWQSSIALHSGRNIIDIPQIGSQNTERGGSLYIKYSGSRADEISLQLRRGAIPVPMLELEDWYSMTEEKRRESIGDYVDKLSAHAEQYASRMNQTSICNATEISMPNVLLSVAAAPVLSAITPTGSDKEASVDILYNNVLAWEEMMHICNTTQGIDNTLENSDMQSRQNIRYMRMFAKAFMYAAGSHIGIGYGSVSGMACGRPVSVLADGAQSNGLFGWGIAHEIGHNMDKLGKAEITNNIYSLMAQTYDGKQNTFKSRLEASNKYKGIYDKVSAGHAGMSNDVFVQLGMYWQLHLAYDDGENPMNFYNTLFKKWKSVSYPAAASADEKFALAASETAGKNLTEFFTSWGVVLSDAVKNELKTYPDEERKVQYLNDESRRYRLNGGQAAEAVTITASTEVIGDKEILLNFRTTGDKSAILGFEISRNGKTIAFVPVDYTDDNTEAAGSYTDIIGSANNKAYTYTVQAIDRLGNKAGECSKEKQVRISYVKTISADEYTITKNNGELTAVMNEQTAVSGIKVTNAPSDGEFTVTITRSTDSGEDVTVTAKNGSFAADETPDEDYYVAYFNKPGADSSDTRIWTYDAKEITVTGIPDTAEVEFISYAGDNIEFNEEASVGYLAHDYRYGDGEDEVIAAGTLVITGAYRGDPLYNTVQINGRFITTDPQTHEQTVTDRAIDGYSLLFAEVPEDGEVSDISDGLFIFVPDVQKEAELQGDVHDCSAVSLLPAQIKAELYRTDVIESADSKRLTSDTTWISSPSGDSMPDIILE